MEFYTDPSRPPTQKLPDGYIWDWDESNGRWNFITDPNKGTKPSTPPSGWPSGTNWYNDPANPPTQQLPAGYVWDWNPATRSWGFTTTKHSSPSTSTPTPSPSPGPGQTPVPPSPPPPPTQVTSMYSFYIPLTPEPVPPTPPWNTTPIFQTPKGIKQATPDIILFDDDTVDLEYIVESYFEEYGGSELINISRHDLINGKEVSYSPIINLPDIRRQFNSNNIISIEQYQQNETKYNIDLVKRGPKEPYFDENGDLIIEIDNIRPDESIEVQIATSGTINRIIT